MAGLFHVRPFIKGALQLHGGVEPDQKHWRRWRCAEQARAAADLRRPRMLRRRHRMLEQAKENGRDSFKRRAGKKES